MRDINSIVGGAHRIASAVDRVLLAELWDGSSEVLKSSLDRDSFVHGIESLRRPLGSVIERQWASVNHQQSTGQTAPAGIYVNVGFDVLLVSGQWRTELLSLRLEEESAWRLAGYQLR